MQLHRKFAKSMMFARIAVGASALAAATMSSLGTASATDYWGGPAEIRCTGLSPNIVDLPYLGSIYAWGGSDKPGVASFTVNPSTSLWGYNTQPTLTWTNVDTGASGTLTGNGHVGFGDPVGVSFGYVPTGAGPIRLDLSVLNIGLVPLPPATCSGTVDVR